jgi:hypothetical protein
MLHTFREIRVSLNIGTEGAHSMGRSAPFVAFRSTAGMELWAKGTFGGLRVTPYFGLVMMSAYLRQHLDQTIARGISP